tara:strand:+ start:4 stop:561 length:558 start_codon:yes stop_codon:yes gene_type:complete
MEYSVSTLKTNTIQAATGSNVSIASGNVLQAPGHVLQVQSMTVTTSATSAAGTTFTDTGLTINITPSSTSSKIYVMSHVSMGATNGYRFALRLVRGSSNISVATSAGSRTVATVAHEGTGGNKIDQTFPIFFLDSPATTSATTYKIQAACEQGGGTWYLNRGGTATDNSTVYAATSSISVMEIAQ